MSVPEYDINDIIKNAVGDKPVMVQKAFDNVVVQKASDIIAGKRDSIAAQYGNIMNNSSEEELNDDELLNDISDEELDNVLNDDEDSEDDLLNDEDLEELQDEESEE